MASYKKSKQDLIYSIVIGLMLFSGAPPCLAGSAEIKLNDNLYDPIKVDIFKKATQEQLVTPNFTFNPNANQIVLDIDDTLVTSGGFASPYSVIPDAIEMIAALELSVENVQLTFFSAGKESRNADLVAQLMERVERLTHRHIPYRVFSSQHRIQGKKDLNILDPHLHLDQAVLIDDHCDVYAATKQIKNCLSVKSNSSVLLDPSTFERLKKDGIEVGSEELKMIHHALDWNLASTLGKLMTANTYAKTKKIKLVKALQKVIPEDALGEHLHRLGNEIQNLLSISSSSARPVPKTMYSAIKEHIAQLRTLGVNKDNEKFEKVGSEAILAINPRSQAKSWLSHATISEDPKLGPVLQDDHGWRWSIRRSISPQGNSPHADPVPGNRRGPVLKLSFEEAQHHCNALGAHVPTSEDLIRFASQLRSYGRISSVIEWYSDFRLNRFWTSSRSSMEGYGVFIEGNTAISNGWPFSEAVTVICVAK
ncbi:MAG: hypothetical protein ABIQ95_05410 [Bdellovibrionia bacterium]